VIPGENLLRKGRTVKICDVTRRGVVAESVITVSAVRRSGDNIIVTSSDGKRITLAEWDFRVGGPPRIVEKADDEAQKKPAKQGNDTARASLDTQVNKYLDDLLSGEFDAEKYAQELLGLAKRGQNVLDVKRTILRMGIARLPDDQRESVRSALKTSFGESPDESEHDAQADVQAPRAGRAGPSV